MPEKDLQKEILELKAQIKHLKKNNLGIVFEEKQEDIVEQCKKNIPVLKEVKKRRTIKNDKLPTNLLIEGDNYHAVSVLNYTHKKSVDVIYIDPPYNTGASDWKYNNDYVDENDAYRHSKWLSMMNNRIKIAKGLLKDDGVLIVTIDKHENATLLMLLAKLFPMHDITTVVVEHNPKGLPSRNFSDSHEYAHFVIPKGLSVVGKNPETKEDTRNLRRAGRASYRSERPTMFYPIYIKDGRVVRIGEVQKDSFHPKKRSSVLESGEIEVWPIDDNGKERRWHFGLDSITDHIDRIEIKEKKGDFQLYVTAVPARYKTVWTGGDLDAGKYGTTLVKNMIGAEFPFPKSLFATARCLETIIYNRKDALVLDFFAGSGTTGHAVLLMNERHGSNHRFILCTNNENQIAEEITYPRIKKVIEGYSNVKGIPANLSYYKTDLVDIEHLHKISDDAKVKITYQAGEMIAVREDTLNEVEKNEWWQIFEGRERMTAIYFKEDKAKLAELITKLEKKDLPVALYIFSWGKNEYKGEYSSANIRVEDIPEPILEVYKELNRL
ncbi:site-specific DNA-methyltransferase [Candidatus Giovannonibacteria bacterium]|nr:site-specific DNA-methyltransferase [Candidatus Giovannonibacteria bacterium]